jgi:hypothetical protein
MYVFGHLLPTSALSAVRRDDAQESENRALVPDSTHEPVEHEHFRPAAPGPPLNTRRAVPRQATPSTGAEDHVAP